MIQSLSKHIEFLNSFVLDFKKIFQCWNVSCVCCSNIASVCVVKCKPTINYLQKFNTTFINSECKYENFCCQVFSPTKMVVFKYLVILNLIYITFALVNHHTMNKMALRNLAQSYFSEFSEFFSKFFLRHEIWNMTPPGHNLATEWASGTICPPRIQHGDGG